jgi:type IV pilus assembly protein PilM
MFKGKFAFDADFIGSLLKPKSPPLIGVDISSSSVKMVELTGPGIVSSATRSSRCPRMLSLTATS